MMLVTLIFVFWTRNSDAIISTGRIEPYISAIHTTLQSGCCNVAPWALYLFGHLKNFILAKSRPKFCLTILERWRTEWYLSLWFLSFAKFWTGHESRVDPLIPTVNVGHSWHVYFMGLILIAFGRHSSSNILRHCLSQLLSQQKS